MFEAGWGLALSISPFLAAAHFLLTWTGFRAKSENSFRSVWITLLTLVVVTGATLSIFGSRHLALLFGLTLVVPQLTFIAPRSRINDQVFAHMLVYTVFVAGFIIYYFFGFASGATPD